MPILRGTPSTYDVPSNAKDISALFYTQKYAESPFFNRILVGDSVVSSEIEWWEDVLLPTSTTLKAAVAADSTTLTLANSASVKEGSLVEIDGTIYRATGNPDDGTGIVSVKAMNADKPTVASVGARVVFLNNARPEGSGRQVGEYIPRARRVNVTQIIDEFASVTGTQQAVAQNVPVTDMIADEASRKLDRIYKNMARAVWYNSLYAPKTNAEGRMFGGVYYLVKQHGFTAGGEFSRQNVDAWLLKCSEELRNPVTEMWLNPLDLARFEGLIQNPQNILIPDGANIAVGHVPTIYVSQNGFRLNLFTDINCKPGRLFLGSPSNVKLRPLAGRQFQMIDSGDKSVDTAERRILGEYTLEYNPVSCDSIYDITD